ncbi:DUF3667 domain-containing protein [Mangrovibacterium lignilyticum]|uniref:DUF3667 domain-containing protein n=1 Tax=Mangrovibacterium lignilyticum TaxID=2668052 RepID=UPI0013D6317D|nr:DUF3667 domain-containing protein [Mangrovibacterium lignilyticum]
MKFTKWFKQEKVPFEELEPHECPNCETVFKGYYCPNCGQSDSEFDRPFGFVVYDFMGNFFSFDSRFFKTFQYLALKPGFLTSEFLAGRRERYAPPFRTFIFLSFLLFLLLQILTGKALKEPIGWEPNAAEGVAIVDSINKEFSDSSFVLTEEELDTLGSGMEVNVDELLAKNSLESKLELLSQKIDEKLQEEKGQEDRKTLLQMKRVLSSPRALTNAILKYLSWAFFAMLPIFAVFLALFYRKRKMHFIRHLVFSVHVHSFVFLINIVVVVLALIWHLPGWIYFMAFLMIQVYIYLALRRFYQQRYWKTFVKHMLLGGIYSLCIAIAFAYVIYNAFMFA